MWHSTDKYRKVVWQCGGKYGGGSMCPSPHFTEEELESFFVSAVNKLLVRKGDIVAGLSEAVETALGTAALEKRREKLETELETVSELMNRYVRENARVALDQDEYGKRYDGLSRRFVSLRGELENVKSRIGDKAKRRASAADFLNELRSLDEPDGEFDAKMFCRLADCYTVYARDDVRVTFRDGTEITA